MPSTSSDSAADRSRSAVATALRMSVMIEPGPMALTLMPWGASDSDITLVSWSSPPFDTQ